MENPKLHLSHISLEYICADENKHLYNCKSFYYNIPTLTTVNVRAVQNGEDVYV